MVQGGESGSIDVAVFCTSAQVTRTHFFFFRSLGSFCLLLCCMVAIIFGAHGIIASMSFVHGFASHRSLVAVARHVFVSVSSAL